MQRLVLILALISLTISGFCINRRMMEDKTMVGFQAGYMLPMGAYANDVNGAIGGGLRGKYFGTNTFAFGFDFGFFAPKMKPGQIAFVKDSVLNPALREAQRLDQIENDTVQITDVTASSQYIPFNISFEFYLPKNALKNFRPYASLGLGLNMINRRYKPTYNTPKTTELLIFEDRVQPSKNRGYMSINPAIGFLATLNEFWNINLEARYNYLLGEQKGGTLTIQFGIIWDLSFKYAN
jgi:hypothetical protein